MRTCIVACMQAFIADWRRGYWGANFDRLLGIKKAYDPINLFTKPFTIGGDAPSKTARRSRRRLRA